MKDNIILTGKRVLDKMKINIFKEISEEITKIVSDRMRYYGIRPKDLASAIAKDCQLSETTAQNLVKSIVRGYAYALLPSINDKLPPTTRLNRLGTILYSLKVNEDDPLINKIKDAYIQFEYPPKSNITRSLEEGVKQLNTDDRVWIEKLVNGVISSYKK